jgi:putative FmdB family regulatory protein
MCQACGHRWEAFQRIKDDPLRDCPQCGAPQAKRQISAGAGFILKGRGWASDNYGSPKSNQEAQRKAHTDGNAASGESGSSTKPDTKPDTSTKTEPTKSSASAS